MNLTKNLNNVDIVTPIPTLEERDQGQSLILKLLAGSLFPDL